MNNIERYSDIILAGAIGDAYGYLVEFDNWKTIKDKYGPNGIQKLHLPQDELIISDDTQMTLFCLDTVNKNIKSSNKDLQEINKDIYKAYIDWNKTQFAPIEKPISKLGRNENLWSREAPGHTCLSALGSGVMGRMDKKINNSKGCGGIMRTAPISFLEFNLKDTFLLGCMQAAITHSHEDGYLSAGFFSGLLKCLIEKESLINGINKNIEILKQYPNHQNILNYINKVVALLDEDLIENDILNNKIGSGWVGEEALGIAIYAMHKGDSFDKVLDISTNHSGDSDSTSSLAAQLYVAKNGLNKEWKDISEKINIISTIKELLINLELSLNNKLIVKEDIIKKEDVKSPFEKIKNLFK